MKILTNKFFILGNLFLILAAIPLTLFFVKQQQDLQSKAAPSSKLYFSPTTANSSTQCPTFTMDVMLDPGTNPVSAIDLYLTYDPALVEVTQITPSSTFNVVQRAASISSGEANLQVDAVAGSTSPDKLVTQIAKVVTVTFAPKSTGTVSIKFDSQSEVFSLGDADASFTNVLASTVPGTAIIGAGACTSSVGTTTGVTPGVTAAPPGLTISITPVGGGVLTPTPTITGSASAQITPPTASATPTLIPTVIPTVAPTATLVPATPTLVQKPTIPPTGSLAQTIGIMATVMIAILGGIVLFAL